MAHGSEVGNLMQQECFVQSLIFFLRGLLCGIQQQDGLTTSTIN
jgi:hypothetical protein